MAPSNKNYSPLSELNLHRFYEITSWSYPHPVNLTFSIQNAAVRELLVKTLLDVCDRGREGGIGVAFIQDEKRELFCCWRGENGVIVKNLN